MCRLVISLSEGATFSGGSRTQWNGAAFCTIVTAAVSQSDWGGVHWVYLGLDNRGQ